MPWLGESLDLSIAPFPSGALTVPIGLLGASNTTWSGVALPLRLDSLGAPGCNLLVSLDALDWLVNNGGIADWDIPIPNVSSLLGGTFYLQGLVLDRPANALGLSLSNAGSATVGVR